MLKNTSLERPKEKESYKTKYTSKLNIDYKTSMISFSVFALFILSILIAM